MPGHISVYRVCSRTRFRKTDQSGRFVKREAAAENTHLKSKGPGCTLQTPTSKDLKRDSCVKKWRRGLRIGPITGFETKALTVCQHMLPLRGRRGFAVRLPPSTPPHKRQHMARTQHQTTVCLPSVIYMAPNKHSKIGVRKTNSGLEHKGKGLFCKYEYKAPQNLGIISQKDFK